jgi:hypothetical protein
MGVFLLDDARWPGFLVVVMDRVDQLRLAQSQLLMLLVMALVEMP